MYVSTLLYCHKSTVEHIVSSSQGCSLGLERLGRVSIPSLQHLGLGVIRLICNPGSNDSVVACVRIV